jgi:hypothetical protein
MKEWSPLKSVAVREGAEKSWRIKKQLEIQIAKLEEGSGTQMAVNKRSQLSPSVTHD